MNDLEFIKRINQKLAERSKAKKLTITFRFEIYSIFNVLIDRFNIEVFTVDEAWLEARRKQRQYPGQTTLKMR